MASLLSLLSKSKRKSRGESKNMISLTPLCCSLSFPCCLYSGRRFLFLVSLIFDVKKYLILLIRFCKRCRWSWREEAIVFTSWYLNPGLRC